MGEIAQEMVSRAKKKLASARLSEVDKSYYEGVIRDFGELATPAAAGSIQEAATPPASSAKPAVKPSPLFQPYRSRAAGQVLWQQARRPFPLCRRTDREQEQEQRRQLFGK